MAVLFISDLHLDPARPGSIESFVAFMQGEARRADTLYILGDLFEAWIGDDDDDPGLSPIIEAISDLTRLVLTTAIYFIHTNASFSTFSFIKKQIFIFARRTEGIGVGMAEKQKGIGTQILTSRLGEVFL